MEDLIIDSEKNAYITGYTDSFDFPTTTGCYDSTFNGRSEWASGDVIVSKLNSDGSDLVYSTFVGGNEVEWGREIVIDIENNAYVTGETWSSDFPTTSGCSDDSFEGDTDGYLFKLNSDGSDLLYSTLVGGSMGEGCRSMTLDAENNAYVLGFTNSEDFPTTSGCYDDSIHGRNEIFFCILTSDGSEITYATLIGGSDYDFGNTIAIDRQKNVYIAGQTWSVDFPTTPGCFDDSHNGEYDGFILKFNSDGVELSYSTFFGGDESDWVNCIQLESENYIYIGGVARTNFPIMAGCYDDTHNGGEDVFLLKMKLIPTYDRPIVTISQPENGSILSGKFRIEGTSWIENGDVEKVEINVTGSSWESVNGTINWHFVWDTSKVKNGNHTIQVRGYSKDGYSEIASINVSVKDEERSDDDENWYEETTYLGGMTAVIIVVVVIAVLFTRKRNAEKYDEWSDDEEYYEE